MTQTQLPDGAASIFAVATRVSPVDLAGYVDPGAATYTTNAAVKVTINPVLETGDDIAIKAASGDLAAFAKHPDMPKYATITLELATPDPYLTAACCGGIVFSDTSTALGAPTAAPTLTAQTTGGTLAAATYSYECTQYNAYGETVGSSVATVTTTGTTGAVVVAPPAPATAALGARIYGRVPGFVGLIGATPNIGSQATASPSGTGTPATLGVTALTKAIPAGMTFQITGDTNTPKIVWTTTQFAPVGAVQIPVTPSGAVATTIAPAAITPVFVDSGAITPAGFLPQADTTGGPGPAGYQSPTLGIVGNNNGVSIEVWTKAIVAGFNAGTLPYYRWVFPRVIGMHTTQRDLTNANTQTVMEGQGYGNPNWGAGPALDWQFDSSKYLQYARCGAAVLPAASNAPLPVAAL